ncbi:hypothetical protein [Vibrio sp. TRT 29B02]|uniref:hypothetical protein n=1 Tax=Vibrio sp. TRT 29B02 TaxID=3418508 RepID=UPI003CF80199
MRIDYEYLNNFLTLVLDNGKSDFKLNAAPFQELWPKGDEQALDKLVFHLEILADQNCLESALTKKDGIGFTRTGSGWIVCIIPLRLTANGHQFASDLTKPTVIEQLKTSFSDAGPNEVVKIAFALGKQILEKKLKQLTDI